MSRYNLWDCSQEEILLLLSRIDYQLSSKGISYADFYSAVGVSASAVSKWRKGATRPRKTVIENIAQYLGVSVDYLMGLDSGKAATPEGDGLNEQKKELIRLWDLVPEDVQLRELDYLRFQAVAKQSSADEQDK